MYGKPVDIKEKQLMISLRRDGYSLKEIGKKLNRSSSLVNRYVHHLELPSEIKAILRSKIGGSHIRAEKARDITDNKAADLIRQLDDQDRLIIASCLYWAEGNKKDFSLTNTDPALIKTFINTLNCFGVSNNRLKVSLRLYEDINQDKAREFWARVTGVSFSRITSINILKGKKTGKLQFGMCRVRVSKGGDTLKLIQSIVKLINNKICYQAPVAQ